MYGHAGNLDFDQVLQPLALQACFGFGKHLKCVLTEHSFHGTAIPIQPFEAV